MKTKKKKRTKYQEGSMLTPPEMEAELNATQEDETPVDTYDNIPKDEMAEALASQKPDNVIEEQFQEYIIDQSLNAKEQEKLLSSLNNDQELAMIFDKLMSVASEFSGAGPVEGIGTGVSDSIPARLSDGEFVFTKKSVDYIGANNLQRIMDEAERAFDKRNGIDNGQATLSNEAPDIT